MSKDLLINILRFVALLLAQAFIFNKINLGGYINPMIYPLFILLLPFEVSGGFLLVISFCFGLCLDLFTGSIGLHASACVFMAFLRPLSLRTISSNRDYEAGIKPGVNDLGYAWFISYTLFLITFHHLFFFFIEAFSFSEIPSLLGRALLSSLFSALMIVLVNLLFKPQEKRR